MNMNMKQAVVVGVLIAGILLFSNLALVAAQENTDGTDTSPVSSDELYNQLQQEAQDYNARLDDVPGIVKRIAGDDVILLDITTNDGEELYIQAITNSGEILYFERASSPDEVDPSITIIMDEETARRIIDSSAPFDEFTSAYGEGEVSVETESTSKRIALGTLTTVNNAM